MQISVGEYSRWRTWQVQRHQGRNELDVPKNQQEGQWGSGGVKESSGGRGQRGEVSLDHAGSCRS